MTETGLLAAQVVFVVLLLGFVWAVVRSSSRTVQRAVAPPPMLVDPVDRRDEPVVVEPPRVATIATPAVADTPPAYDPMPVTATPAAITTPTDPFADAVSVPVFTADPADDHDSLADAPGAQRARVDRERMDLAANLNPHLVVEASDGLEVGASVALEGGLTIGRSPSSDLQIDDAFVSHMHARILRRGPFYFVEDLGSTNGTFLNGQRIAGDAQLRVRDELRFGETTLRYEE